MFSLFGKIGESTAPRGSIDYNAFLKALRMALMAGGATAITVFGKEVVGLDLLPDSNLDEMLLIPALTYLIEQGRRFFADYSKDV